MKITRDLAQTHPIKREPSLTPPKVHIHQTSPFWMNRGAAAIHRQRQTIPQHQAIASTSILAKIARELAKIHPIKHRAFVNILPFASSMYLEVHTTGKA